MKQTLVLGSAVMLLVVLSGYLIAQNNPQGIITSRLGSERIQLHQQMIGQTEGQNHQSARQSFFQGLLTEDVMMQFVNVQNKKLNASPFTGTAYSESLIYGIDTAMVFSIYDTTRIVYSYNELGKLTDISGQRWGNNQWVNDLRYHRTYDIDGNVLTILIEYWSTNQWMNDSRWTYTYDANAKPLTAVYESWPSDQWVKQFQIVLIYDDNGNLLVKSEQPWDNNQWSNGLRDTYTYDGNGNRLTHLFQSWFNNQWNNNNRFTLTYDGSGNQLTDIDDNWMNDQWATGGRRTKTYDANGNQLTYVYESWTDNQWLKRYHYISSYDASGNILTYVGGPWDNSQWVDLERNTFTYDANGDLLTNVYETRSNDQWANSARSTYQYSQKSLWSTAQYESWDGSSWQTTSNQPFHLTISKDLTYSFTGYKISLTYASLVTDVSGSEGTIPVEYSLSQNYPNPFNPSTTLRYGFPVRSTVTLTVFNTLGQTITQFENQEVEAGVYEQSFNASHLPSGLYFYRMEAASVEDPEKVFVQTRKMVLLK